MHDLAARTWHHVLRNRDADEGKPRHQPENSADADEMRGHRAGYQRDHEGGADADADHRHRLRAIFLRGEVGDHGEDDGAYGARALQRAANDDAADGARARGDQTADAEQDQPEDDHDLAA